MAEKSEVMRAFDNPKDWFEPHKEPGKRVFDMVRFQAEQLRKTGSTMLLYPIPPDLMVAKWHDEPQWKFGLDRADPDVRANYAMLWHYVGDATHHSERFSTPHGWKVGDTFEAENRFNVPRCTVVVKAINLHQNPVDNNWFWVITLEK